MVVVVAYETAGSNRVAAVRREEADVGSFMVTNYCTARISNVGGSRFYEDLQGHEVAFQNVSSNDSYTTVVVAKFLHGIWLKGHIMKTAFVK